MEPHSTPPTPWIVAIPGGAVRALELVIMSENANSFQAKIRQKTAVAAMPVTHWGSTILRKACRRL